MSETKRENAVNYLKPPLHTRFKKGKSGNARGRPVKNLPGVSGRGARRAGVRHHRQTTAEDHEA